MTTSPRSRRSTASATATRRADRADAHPGARGMPRAWMTGSRLRAVPSDGLRPRRRQAGQVGVDGADQAPILNVSGREARRPGIEILLARMDVVGPAPR